MYSAILSLALVFYFIICFCEYFNKDYIQDTYVVNEGKLTITYYYPIKEQGVY